MATEVHDRKLARRFELLDADGDGYLERDDYEVLARKLIQGFAESPDTPKGKAVIDTYLRFWEEFVSRMDANGDGKVSLEEFVTSIENQIIDADDFDRVFRPHVTAVSELADTNNDGAVDRGEYIRLMGLYGVDRQEAESAFDRIDVDHDNELSVAELTAAARDFYLSADDTTAGSALFGHH